MQPVDLSIKKVDPPPRRPGFRITPAPLPVPAGTYKDLNPIFYPRPQLPPSGMVTPPALSPDATVPSMDNFNFIERPFKTLMKNSPVLLQDLPMDPEMTLDVENKILQEAEAQLGGQHCKSKNNANMRRTPYSPRDNCDSEYLEKRRKNNAAAKKSRDMRRYKEDLLAMKYKVLLEFYKREVQKSEFLSAQVQSQQVVIEGLRQRLNC